MESQNEELGASALALDAHWPEARRVVFGVAYRLLGSVADAEDVTHDVWLRAAKAELAGVDDVQAWLATVAARRSYDILKSARVRRERYVGPWLPEPLVTGPDASESVILDDSISTAMLVLMEQLSPPERVAVVMHDVFEFDFTTVAEILGVSATNARQLASRGRRRVAGAHKSSSPASRAERERVLRAFKSAYEARDFAALIKLLHPEIVYLTDGGGQVFAARRPIEGRERVSEVMVRVGRRWKPDQIDLVEVNGELGLRFDRQGQVFSLDTIDLRDGLIVGYRRVMNPAKLARV